tara:strand:+ start:5777 stop:6568 length:792 start_codon:yes stop_codon:yes gene_type:complete
MKRLIHLGCSFAVGNAIPHYIQDLPDNIAPAVHNPVKKFVKDAITKFKIEIKDRITCGNWLANKLNLGFKNYGENGQSNDAVFRKLLAIDLTETFVLIGITGGNRREGLTTRNRRQHWHTYKMVGPSTDPGYKDISFNPWVNKSGIQEYTPALEEEEQMRVLLQIIYMQNYLKANNVPYLMFHALYNGFDKPLTDESKAYANKVDEKNFYKFRGTFDECQHGYCLKEGLTVSNYDEHPNVQGQKKWGGMLLEQALEIKKNASR